MRHRTKAGVEVSITRFLPATRHRNECPEGVLNLDGCEINHKDDTFVIDDPTNHSNDPSSYIRVYNGDYIVKATVRRLITPISHDEHDVFFPINECAYKMFFEKIEEESEG